MAMWWGPVRATDRDGVARLSREASTGAGHGVATPSDSNVRQALRHPASTMTSRQVIHTPTIGIERTKQVPLSIEKNLAEYSTGIGGAP
jgi:hypothetical protein